MHGCLVTGTDTDCGKTLVSLALMQALQSRGLLVNGFKPVAAGSEVIDGQKTNRDAWQMLQQNSTVTDYHQVNPILFEAAVAPHLAASQQGVEIAMPLLVRRFERLMEQSDFVVVEGAGGWLVPLDDHHDVADLASLLGLPVVLVVGLKLGCINHARLTAEQIIDSGAHLLGWVGSQVQNKMPLCAENVHTLEQYLPCPCMGVLPFWEQPQARHAAAYLDVELLLDKS